MTTKKTNVQLNNPVLKELRLLKIETDSKNISNLVQLLVDAYKVSKT